MWTRGRWAKLPTIGKIEVSIGKELHQQWLWAGTLIGVDSLTITAHTSDGRVFTSPVCMAVAPEPPKKALDWATDCVLVTPEAEQRLAPSEIWYHFGGWSDEGDTYETQESQFEEEINRFWPRSPARTNTCGAASWPLWQASARSGSR